MRGLGAAVVVLKLVKGTGSGSGTCCSWLRGLGAAVLEGSGREREDVRVGLAEVYCTKSSGNCNGCWYDRNKRTGNLRSYKCEPTPCNDQCRGNGNTCQCECKCCLHKREEESKRLAAASLHSTSQHSLPDSSEAQQQAAKQEHQSPPEALKLENKAPPFRPDPKAIAAVIVALIVAIILLDLCIFRFPVGRNIRDFLVRKIPFCIAFYS
ncbi:hypothetical protein, conserved [Babesia bigemina]|uniref:Uncharacterized protein n=1 Tax=Babesia bigemina TaxID=5866 RepID=A0A061BKM9_BABBI|nr:hypothetical protein, conserved [Babesia bigemina]CDR71992.1 hypothetical protein, conserved [Babesia bigemina]|eukprot:XP_012770933.1 hypothetical protein, conserved [Babesia bigemina]